MDGRFALVTSLLACSAFAAPVPTFYHDVLPILEKNCQSCHRPGEIGPMALETYQQARPWAKAIRQAVLTKKMPPWFADATVGKYANDRSLSQADIATLASWVDTGTTEGDPKDGPKQVAFTDGWRIGTPDVVFEMSKAFPVPASGTIPYEYIIVPTGFKEDKWIQAVEFRPGEPAVVHHSSIYSREPGSTYAAGHKPGEFFELDEEVPVEGRKRPVPGRLMFSAPDFPLHLQVFVPGGDPVVLPPGQARLIKAGSDIIFQVHYTANGKAVMDRSRIGLIFAKTPPVERVKTVRIQNGVPIRIPPGDANYRLESRVIVQQPLRIVSLQPHMHFRGSFFEYSVIYPSGESEVLLRTPHYNFHWQQTYYLDKPRLLPKGTILIVKAGYDNSANNPDNPDPKAWVKGGAQSWDEMMAGFMDVGFDPKIASPDFFLDAPPVTATASTGGQ
ncbi:MAG: thiol-disulfide isomerase [Acidobacteriia bacterium]|nr:thiol-disulfide isomerase [Terriglobia bacterium]